MIGALAGGVPLPPSPGRIRPVSAAPFRVGQRVYLPNMAHLGYARVQLCRIVKDPHGAGGGEHWEVMVKWARTNEIQDGISACRLCAC